MTYFDDNYFSIIPRSTIEYVLTIAALIQKDFVNDNVYQTDEGFKQVILRQPSFEGMYSLWYTNPVGIVIGNTGFQGTIQWSSLFHEMGHNFTLNTPQDYYYGGKIDGNANAIFSESMAQIFQHATAYEIINNAGRYGLSEYMVCEIKQSAISSILIVRNAYEKYLNSGMEFCSWNDPETSEDETFNTFMTIAYKFCEHAENAGLGYRTPLKRMMEFLQIFNEDLKQRYAPHSNTPIASTFRATFMVAALSYAFSTDLRMEFKDLNFPVSDEIYEELINLSGGGRPLLPVKLSLSKTSASPGDTLTIPILVDDAAGIAGIEATISFDPDVLEAIDVYPTILTQGFVLADTISPGQVRFSLARATGLDGGSGALAEIIFRVVGTVGDSTGLVFERIVLYDENTEEIPVSGENGSVKVVPLPIERIEISPDTVVVEIGKQQEFLCKGYDREGKEVSVVPIWEVEPSELGGITSEGLFSGTGRGKGLVIAEVNGLKDSSVVWVGEKGDVNLDGVVDVRDGIICLRLVAGLLLPPKPLHEATVYEKWASDISRDGEVTAGDALLILYKGLGRPVPKVVMASGIAYVMMEEEGGCSRLVVEGRRDIYAAEVWLRGIDLREVRPVRKDVMWVENRGDGEVRVVLVGLGGILGDEGEMLEVLGEGIEVEEVRLFGVSGQELGVLLEGREFGDLSVYPNPFNGVLHVRYVVGDVGKVGIYDVLGRLVRDWRVGFGEGKMEWDGRDRFGRFVSSGVYFVRLEVGDVSRTKKVVFVR